MNISGKRKNFTSAQTERLSIVYALCWPMPAFLSTIRQRIPPSTHRRSGAIPSALPGGPRPAPRYTIFTSPRRTTKPPARCCSTGKRTSDSGAASLTLSVHTTQSPLPGKCLHARHHCGFPRSSPAFSPQIPVFAAELSMGDCLDAFGQRSFATPVLSRHRLK